MKIYKLNWALMLIVFISIGAAVSVTAQVKKERKVEIKKTITNSGESIHVRIEKEDGSIYEKTYRNAEEMQNDPELQGLDLDFVSAGGLDGNLQWISSDKDGIEKKRIMKIKSKDGGLHKFKEDTNVWIHDLHTDEDKAFYIFKNDSDSYKIIKGEDGELQIEKNGIVMDVDALEKDGETNVEVFEDGSIFISDGNTKMKINRRGDGVFIGEGDSLLHKFMSDDQNIMIFKSEDGDDFTMEFSEDLQWEADSLHNKFFFSDDSDVNIEESDDGKYVFKMEVEADTDSEGNRNVFVTRTVQRINIEILDITDEKEISQVPGVHLNEGKNLKLEEVEYYPNPSEGQFTLKFRGKDKPTQVKILDMKGTEVYNEQLQDFNGFYNNEINLAGNEPGLYLLQVIQNDRSWTKKIVIE